MLGMQSKSYTKYHTICNVIFFSICDGLLLKRAISKLPGNKHIRPFWKFFIARFTVFYYIKNGNQE